MVSASPDYRMDGLDSRSNTECRAIIKPTILPPQGP